MTKTSRPGDTSLPGDRHLYEVKVSRREESGWYESTSSARVREFDVSAALGVHDNLVTVTVGFLLH